MGIPEKKTSNRRTINLVNVPRTFILLVLVFRSLWKISMLLIYVCYVQASHIEPTLGIDGEYCTKMEREVESREENPTHTSSDEDIFVDFTIP